MSSTHEISILVQEVLRLARALPLPLLQSLAERLSASQVQDGQAYKGQFAQAIAQPHYRALVIRFLEVWQSQVPAMTPTAVAAALWTAAASESAHRQDQAIELVWTGPAVGTQPLRQTEQALLQLIHAAQHSLIIVSYAVYKIPRICAALLDAARRAVQISFIVETPDRLAGQNTYDTLKALGQTVATQCMVYYWPLEQRPQDAQGRTGILHPKCAVADSRWLFISSANLTEYAFTVNQELGVLITGGNLPGQIEQHFQQMIRERIFQKV